MKVNIEFLEKRENFIPFRIPVLLKKILEDPRIEPANREKISIIADMFFSRFHFDFLDDLRKIKNDFAPFDPDSDTLGEPDLSSEEIENIGNTLIEKVEKLAVVCNFVPLSEEEFNHCLTCQPLGGLTVQVDLKDFQFFRVYIRGIQPDEIRLPRWKFWIRKKTRETSIFKKVFILAKYKSDLGGKIIIKMFKNVPLENLKIVAPKVNLMMPVFDQIKIGGTVCTGLFPTLYKIVLALFYNAVVLSGWVIAVLLFGLIMSGIKGILGFLNSKTKYMQIYSSSLYYQNLSNNASAISSLVVMAEEQEIKEILLAWFMLYVQGEKALSSEELDRMIEEWILAQFHFNLDFEISDALRKLEEKDLLRKETDEAGVVRYRVYDIGETLRRLDAAWDNIYPYNC
ncbi:MAG: DUF3754 domain-containing protein [Planctomycetia bacterium]|nr:DUF3754 domain-containing protein [Planctomycetia bacterium]